MSNKTYVDGLLVDWGASLFNQGSVVTTAGGRSKSGAPPRKSAKPKAEGGVLRKGGPSGLTQSAAVIRSKLGAIAKRTPEVMVKIVPGSPKGMRQIKRQLDYISRKGEIALEDQDGNVRLGKDEVERVRDEWQLGGDYIDEEEGKLREAFHVVFSMGEGTDELAIKRAVRDFAAREFEGHQYVMAMHTFETDPDPKPSKHPHVHVAVKARHDESGIRLNPRKGDLQRWREDFAAALREHGIEAAATNRLQRLQQQRGEKQSVRQMRESGRPLTRMGKTKSAAEKAAAKEAAIAKEREVLATYRKLCDALTRSEDVEDRKLGIGVARRLWEDRVGEDRALNVDSARDQPQDRDRDPPKGRGHGR